MNIKKALISILIILTILALGASYLFSPAPVRQPQPEDTGFTGPTGEPYVNGPTSPPPAFNGPQ